MHTRPAAARILLIRIPGTDGAFRNYLTARLTARRRAGPRSDKPAGPLSAAGTCKICTPSIHQMARRRNYILWFQVRFYLKIHNR